MQKLKIAVGNTTAILIVASVVPCIAASNDVVQPADWLWIPSWSRDGRFVIVRVSPEAAAAKKKGLMHDTNSEMTLVLDGRTFRKTGIKVSCSLSDSEWSPDGHYFSGSRLSSGAGVFDTLTAQEVLGFDTVDAHGWSSDGQRIFTTVSDGIEIWDVPGRKKIGRIPGLTAGMHAVFACAPVDKRFAVAVSSSNSSRSCDLLRICSTDTGAIVFSKDVAESIGTIGWSADGSLFAYSDTCVHVLDGHNFEEKFQTGDADNDKAAEFRWSPDGKFLAYRGGDNKLTVFDIAKGQAVRSITAEKDGRFTFEWSSDNSLMSVLDCNGQLAIFEMPTAKFLGSKKLDGSASFQWIPNTHDIAAVSFDAFSTTIIKLDEKRAMLGLDFAQKDNPWEGQKVASTLKDTFAYLDTIFSPTDLTKFRDTPHHRLFLYEGGPGLGMHLRNYFGLRSHNSLTKFFKSYGITDGAKMSSIIIEAYWLKQNGKEIDLRAVCEPSAQQEREQQYISRMNTPLPQSILTVPFQRSDDSIVRVGDAKSGLKILAFTHSNSDLGLEQVQALRSFANKFPGADKVFIVKFPDESNRLNRTDEINLILRGCNGMNVVTGSSALLDALKRFCGGKLSNWMGKLPQTLIISSDGRALARINGPISRDNQKLLTDLYDECSRK